MKCIVLPHPNGPKDTRKVVLVVARASPRRGEMALSRVEETAANPLIDRRKYAPSHGMHACRIIGGDARRNWREMRASGNWRADFSAPT